MTVLVPLPPDDVEVQIVPMLTTSRAVDLWLGDLTRRGYSARTISTYRWHLDKFTDTIRPDADVTDIRPDDCRRHLDRWNTRHAQGTRAHGHTVLNSFLEWLYLQQRIKRNPLDHVAKPRRIRSDDLDVVTIATVDVPQLLAAANTWAERLAVAIVAYMGPRRHAAALLRLRDYNRDRQLMRFREKGAKTIWKPVPAELAQLLEAAIADGAIVEPDDYLIPAEGPLTRAGDRDDRVIWRLVKRAADRAGIECHVHALRAAFATFYLEQNPNDIVGLQELMGHASIETTRVYLRKLDKQRAMEGVRTLSWAGVDSGFGGGRGADTKGAGSPDIPRPTLPQTAGIQFEETSLVGAGGFEPPFADTPLPVRAGTLRDENDLVAELLERARELEAELA